MEQYKFYLYIIFIYYASYVYISHFLLIRPFLNTNMCSLYVIESLEYINGSSLYNRHSYPASLYLSSALRALLWIRLYFQASSLIQLLDIIVSFVPHIHNKLIYKSAGALPKHSRNNITLNYVRFIQIAFKHTCHTFIANTHCYIYKIIHCVRINCIGIWHIISFCTDLYFLIGGKSASCINISSLLVQDELPRYLYLSLTSAS